MTPRPFSDYEISVIRKLWPTALRDVDLAERLGRHRGVVYRRGRAAGLPPRRLVRRAERLAR